MKCVTSALMQQGLPLQLIINAEKMYGLSTPVEKLNDYFVCVMCFLVFEQEQCCFYADRRFNSQCMCVSQPSASIPYHSAAVSWWMFLWLCCQAAEVSLSSLWIDIFEITSSMHTDILLLLLSTCMRTSAFLKSLLLILIFRFSLFTLVCHF